MENNTEPANVNAGARYEHVGYVALVRITDRALAAAGLLPGDQVMIKQGGADWEPRDGEVILATVVHDGTTSTVLGVYRHRGDPASPEFHAQHDAWLEYAGPEPWGHGRVPGSILYAVGPAYASLRLLLPEPRAASA